MKALFANRLAPLSYCMGFLELPFDALVEAARMRLRNNFPGVRELASSLPLDASLLQLQPIKTPRDRILLLETTSPWTAYFDNSRRGSDPAGFVGSLSMKLKCRGLLVRWEPAPAVDDSSDDFTASTNVTFTLYAPDKRAWLNVERSVSVVDDDGDWSFEATGTVQSYEQVERYQARVIANRFTPEMLVAYCASLGIRPFEADFYRQTGHLFELDM